MVINEREFPVVVQAFQTAGTQDVFVAEQVVNNQYEADNFTSRYAGYLIKARVLAEAELKTEKRIVDNRKVARRSPGAAVLGVILLLLVAIVIVGFTTGWIQENLNIHLN